MNMKKDQCESEYFFEGENVNRWKSGEKKKKKRNSSAKISTFDYFKNLNGLILHHFCFIR